MENTYFYKTSIFCFSFISISSCYREVNILICFILVIIFTLSLYTNIFKFHSFSLQKIFVSVFANF